MLCGELIQEDLELEVILDYKVKPCLKNYHHQNPTKQKPQIKQNTVNPNLNKQNLTARFCGKNECISKYLLRNS
ncbi:hypothetical protein I79_004541 [Cricetulus griseus]|uniref:Uncharacterized protein n=1 Tax=Cricetulus griseus TaxID=10029 RepID=G3H2T9_CRIGR|nr:hypothetical protein I79_004541 [Cricetulus griseus]